MAVQGDASHKTNVIAEPLIVKCKYASVAWGPHGTRTFTLFEPNDTTVQAVLKWNREETVRRVTLVDISGEHVNDALLYCFKVIWQSQYPCLVFHTR